MSQDLIPRLRSALCLVGLVSLGALATLAACVQPERSDVEDSSPTSARYEVADRILFFDRVHSIDDAAPRGSAIAIRGSRILAISSEDGILRHRGAKTTLKRFLGAHAYPGLQDAHGHIAGLGDAGLDLRGLPSYQALVERVRAYASELPPGTWILGRGWDQNRWPVQEMPDHAELSTLVSKHPVFLTRVDGHAALANAMAMKRARLDAETKAPAGGRILRRADRQPTGVLVDNAMRIVRGRIPMPSIREIERRLLSAQEKCFRVGLTRVHDAGVSGPVRRLMRRLEKAGKWKLGVYGMLPAPTGPNALPAPDDPGPRARVRFRAVKLYADGALGSSLAALLSDYSDEKGNAGQLTSSEAELRDRITWCRDKGYQPCIHAIGDRANRVVLDLYASLMSDEQRALLRPRVEHAQVLALVDLKRFRALGVIASMQPTHLTSDMPWAPRRLGADRVKGAYAFRTLLEDGSKLCFGSDFPVEAEDPLEGIFAAVTTIPPRLPDAKPLRSDQALSRRASLHGFTGGAAYAAFEEDVRGRIAPGYEADLTILDRNLLDESAPPRAILGAKVLATIVGGEIVWER